MPGAQEKMPLDNEAWALRVSQLEAERDFYKQQYEQTREQLRYANLLLENMPDFISIAGLDGGLTMINRGGREMMGLPEDADISQVWMQQFFFEEDTERIHNSIMPVVLETGRWDGEMHLRHMQTGETIICDHTVFIVRDNETGEDVALGTIARNIGERKAAEELQQKLAAVIENSSDFISIAETSGKIIFVNEAGRKLVGFESNEEALESWMQQYYTPEDLAYVENEVMQIVKREDTWQGMLRFRHFKTGEVFPIAYSVVAVRDKLTHKMIAIATIARDIREQLQAEAERAALQEQVIEAQRMVIRELGTPLIPLADGIVAMPLLGTIDSRRTQQIMETLLEGCSQLQAEVVILDITGVKVVDIQVADGLIRTARAASLLGSEVIITGIGPEVAQTLVQLGVDLGSIVTRSTLQNGIEYALQTRKLGFRN
jgi:rsbT co-antagonist protein RsbR